MCEYTAGAHIVACELGDIVPGAPPLGQKNVLITVLVNSDVPHGTVLRNRADGYTFQTPDPNPDDNRAIQRTTVNAEADLHIEKYGEPQKVFAGEQLKYTIKVTNRGMSDATNVVVTDTLPQWLTYETDTDSCVAVGQDLTCTRPYLAAGETWTFMVWALVDPATPAGTELDNCASVAWYLNPFEPGGLNNVLGTDPNLANNTGLRQEPGAPQVGPQGHEVRQDGRPGAGG